MPPKKEVPAAKVTEKRPLPLFSPRVLEMMAKTDMMPVVGFTKVERLPTGIVGLDYVLGGGLPLGHAITITGDPSCGKTTSMLLATRHVTETLGRHVIIFDTENGCTPDWVLKIGLNPELVHLIQPAAGEEMLNLLAEILRSAERGETEAPALVIIDSIPGTAFTPELAEEAIGAANMGVAARRWSQARRVLMPPLMRLPTCLVFVNQLTWKIGVPGPMAPKVPTEEYGGRALKYMSSIRLRMMEPDRKSKPGFVIFRYKTVKNRTVPVRESQSAVAIGEKVEIFNLPELLDLGKELKVFTNSSGEQINGAAKWHFGGQPLGTGKDNTLLMLSEAENATLRKQIEEAVFRAMGDTSVGGGWEQEDDDNDGDTE